MLGNDLGLKGAGVVTWNFNGQLIKVLLSAFFLSQLRMFPASFDTSWVLSRPKWSVNFAFSADFTKAFESCYKWPFWPIKSSRFL